MRFCPRPRPVSLYGERGSEITLTPNAFLGVRARGEDYAAGRRSFLAHARERGGRRSGRGEGESFPDIRFFARVCYNLSANTIDISPRFKATLCYCLLVCSSYEQK